MERDIIVVGTSAGGFETLPKLFSQLNSELEASIFVVQHMESGSTGEEVIRTISQNTSLHCALATNNEHIEYGKIYVAPPDHHLLLKEGKVLVLRGPRENRYRPSIDMLFRSAAAHYNNRVIGIILTGLLDDGACGMEAIQQSEGTTIIQHPDDALFAEMPVNTMRSINVDFALPVQDMGIVIRELVAKPVSTNGIAPSYIRQEAAIAERFTSPVKETEKLGHQIPFSCPDCGGSLFKVSGSDLQRYRCHVGHIFNEVGLLKAHAQKIEESLWTSLRLWEERLHMLLGFKETEIEKGRKRSGNSLTTRIEEVENQIKQIRGLLNYNELYNN